MHANGFSIPQNKRISQKSIPLSIIIAVHKISSLGKTTTLLIQPPCKVG